MKSFLLTMTIVATGFLGSYTRAFAQDVPGEIFVVLASQTAGPVDPSLAREPALQQPPFNMFHSMRVLSRSAMALHTSRAFTTTLPNGRTIRVELLGQTPDHRYRVRVSINRPGQSDYLQLLTVVASPADPFFVVGQNYQGGTLVIGVRVGTRPASAANSPSHGATQPPS